MELNKQKQQLQADLSTIKTQLSTAESITNSLSQTNQQLIQQNQQLTQEIDQLRKQLDTRPLTVDLNKSKPIASVSVTRDSFSSARQGSGSQIRLNSASGNYYSVIQDGSNYYLIPNYPQMKFDDYQVAEVLFDCNGYQQGVRSNFRVESPATVVRATGNSSEWVLGLKGKLSFY